MVLAAMAGGVAGIGVLVKLYWQRFLGLFSAKHRERAAGVEADLVGE
jgi:hypothetical protein